MNESIADQIKYIKDQVEFHSKQSKRKQFKGSPTTASMRHEEAVSKLQSIEETLSSLQNNTQPLEASISHESEDNSDDLFSITASEIDSLPDSIKDVLNMHPSEILDGQIIELLGIANRPLSLKELIIGLYRKFDYEVPERNPFASKLYRMKDSGQIKSVKKGYYVLPNYEDEKSPDKTEESDMDRDVMTRTQRIIQKTPLPHK